MAHLAAPSHPSPTSRPTSSFSSLNIGSSPSSPPDPTQREPQPYAPFSSDSDSDSDSSADRPLPFPTALPRADFLTPNFDAAAYLSALHAGGPAARHQTLEDLRAELRARSAAASAELLALVNANYAAFLGLGDGLRGGEGRVEDVRVALLGFRRAVEDVMARVGERRREVGKLSGELGGVRSGIELGRRMLELDERVAALEDKLAVGSYGAPKKARDAGDGETDDGWDDDEESDEEEGDGDDGGQSFVGSSPAKLTALALDYAAINELADAIGRDLPFVKKTDERTTRCRNTILLDLGTALKEACKAGAGGHARVVKLLGIYGILEAESEAVRVLKEK